MTRRDMLRTAGSASALFTMEQAFGQAMPLKNLGVAPAGSAHPFARRPRRRRSSSTTSSTATVSASAWSRRAPSRRRKRRASARRWRPTTCARSATCRCRATKPALAHSTREIKASKEAGIIGIHAAMTGRRYEDFDTFEAFKTNFERCQKIVQTRRADPAQTPDAALAREPQGLALRRAGRLAPQAGQRVGRRPLRFRQQRRRSAKIPWRRLRNLLPYTLACHIKDMAVQPYEDGFLLSEVPLGEGFLDLKGMVGILQKKDPNIPLDLEMITRDPLKIPIFTRQILGDLRRHLQPAAGPRSGARHGNRRKRSPRSRCRKPAA